MIWVFVDSSQSDFVIEAKPRFDLFLADPHICLLKLLEVVFGFLAVLKDVDLPKKNKIEVVDVLFPDNSLKKNDLASTRKIQLLFLVEE